MNKALAEHRRNEARLGHGQGLRPPRFPFSRHLRVRLTKDAKRRMCEGPYSSAAHIREIGGLVGLVVGESEWFLGGMGPELDVRWPIGKFGIRYCYHPNDLERAR
jgi:hypothetical protein